MLDVRFTDRGWFKVMLWRDGSFLPSGAMPKNPESVREIFLGPYIDEQGARAGDRSKLIGRLEVFAA
jgi:hypothetical protein